MYRVFLFIFLSSLPLGFSSHKSTKLPGLPLPGHYKLYREINLHGLLSFRAFEQAVTGYNKIEAKNKDLLTIIDFSKPSMEERLFIIDMKQKKTVL